MHIVVVGAGALGVYFGGRWQEAGADVTFLVREKRAQQIKEHGLKVNSTKGDYELKQPKVVTNVADITGADFVFVSVKGFHLEGTIDSLKALTSKGAYVLPVLNGMEHISILQERVGKKHVLGGLAFIMATLNEQGHAIQTGDFHQLIVGPLDAEQEDICKKIEALSMNANMEFTYGEDILNELWKKYMFINAFSGITTAANLSIGPIRKHEETFYIAEKVLQETKQLANEYGAQLINTDVEDAKGKLMSLGGDATSSMHQDLRKEQVLELDHLHGGAIRLAKAAGISLPFTEAIFGLIKPYENA